MAHNSSNNNKKTCSGTTGRIKTNHIISYLTWWVGRFKTMGAGLPDFTFPPIVILLV